MTNEATPPLPAPPTAPTLEEEFDQVKQRYGEVQQQIAQMQAGVQEAMSEANRLEGEMRLLQRMFQRQQQTAASPPGAGVPQGPQPPENGLVGPDGAPLHHQEPQAAPDLPVVRGSKEVAGTGPIAEA